jgi:hypothetical protein
VLAEFRDPELDLELVKARIDRENNELQINAMDDRLWKLNDQNERNKLSIEISKLYTDRGAAAAKVQSLEMTRDQDLVLRAPCDGIIGLAPSIEDISKQFPPDPNTPFITVNTPGRVRICLPVTTLDFNRLKEDLEHLSKAAVRTKGLMKARVTVAYENTRLVEVLEDLKKQVKGLRWKLDTEAGASEDLRVSYQANERRLELVLGEVFERIGLGYYIVSDRDSKDDGCLLIRPGSERGEPLGGRQLADLDVTIRVQGRDSSTWKGKIRHLPESEAKTVPLILSNRAGGPVAVKAGTQSAQLVPATQQYLVYVEIVDPDQALVPGTMAQVKIYCQPETCLHWLWRTLNNTFDLGLM